MSDRETSCAVHLAPLTLVVTVCDGTILPAALAALEEQKARPAQVIAVYRGPLDTIPDLLRAWQPPDGTCYLLIEAARSSMSLARNLGVESAVHDYLAVVEEGVQLGTNWLMSIWAALAEGFDVAGGPMTAAGSTAGGHAIAILEARKTRLDRANQFLLCSRAIGFSRAIWDDAGGFPEWAASNGDRIFALALRHAGAQSAYLPQAVAALNPTVGVHGYVADCLRNARTEAHAALIVQATAAAGTRSAGGDPAWTAMTSAAPRRTDARARWPMTDRLTTALRPPNRSRTRWPVAGIGQCTLTLGLFLVGALAAAVGRAMGGIDGSRECVRRIGWPSPRLRRVSADDTGSLLRRNPVSVIALIGFTLNIAGDQ